ncbi:MAG: hypothetical protein WD267_06430 [Balneolales bacterium]
MKIKILFSVLYLLPVFIFANVHAIPSQNGDIVQSVIDPAYPGQPAPGKVFWGAAINGNGDPVVRHENPSGETMALRRTFWRWDQRVSNMITTASDDIENGRLPWVSVKPPSEGDHRWQRIANGEFDDELDAMLLALDALGGPVWFTMHHEPENDNKTTFGGIGT